MKKLIITTTIILSLTACSVAPLPQYYSYDLSSLQLPMKPNTAVGYPRHESSWQVYWPNPYGNFPGEMHFTKDYEYCVDKSYDVVDMMVLTMDVQRLFQALYIGCMQNERGYHRDFLDG